AGQKARSNAADKRNGYAISRESFRFHGCSLVLMIIPSYPRTPNLLCSAVFSSLPPSASKKVDKIMLPYRRGKAIPCGSGEKFRTTKYSSSPAHREYTSRFSLI